MNSKERIETSLKVATETKVFELGRGILDKAPVVFNELFPGRKAVIVADVNTWPVAGEKVYELFVKNGIPVEKYIIDKKEFHAEWKYIEMVDEIVEGNFDAAKNIENEENHVEADAEKAFKEPCDGNYILVSVGSGVINDLCKLCSYHHSQRYLTIPTAASVDGFTSFGASISYRSSKQTFSCPAPIAVIADVDVISTAPGEMTAAGYADLAAKVPAGGEWVIANFLGKAPLRPEAWHVVHDYLDDQLSNPEGVARNEPDAIADLFEGLTLSGFAMQAAQSSRPASCCDHLFSHILDMTAHRYHGKLQSHGFQVAIGTLTMCAVFDQFFKMDFSGLDIDKCVDKWPSLEEEQRRAIEIFKDFPAPMLGYNEITRKYDGPEVVRQQLTKFKAEWPQLMERLRKLVYPFDKMQALFKAAGAPYDPSMIGVTRRQLHNMFEKVQLMRYRINILDLAKRGGFYDQLVEPLFAKGGAWDLSQEQPII